MSVVEQREVCKNFLYLGVTCLESAILCAVSATDREERVSAWQQIYENFDGYEVIHVINDLCQRRSLVRIGRNLQLGNTLKGFY